MKFPFTRVTVTHFFSGNPSWGSFNKFWQRTKITYWEEALYTQVFRLLETGHTHLHFLNFPLLPREVPAASVHRIAHAQLNTVQNYGKGDVLKYISLIYALDLAHERYGV